MLGQLDAIACIRVRMFPCDASNSHGVTVFTSSQSDSVGSDSFQYMQSDLRLRPVSFCSSIIIQIDCIGLHLITSIWVPRTQLDCFGYGGSSGVDWICTYGSGLVGCYWMQSYAFGFKCFHMVYRNHMDSRDLPQVTLTWGGSDWFQWIQSDLHLRPVSFCTSI